MKSEINANSSENRFKSFEALQINFVDFFIEFSWDLNFVDEQDFFLLKIIYLARV